MPEKKEKIKVIINDNFSASVVICKKKTECQTPTSLIDLHGISEPNAKAQMYKIITSIRKTGCEVIDKRKGKVTGIWRKKPESKTKKI